MADPKLYGVGLVVKVEGAQSADQRCFIRWPTMPDREPRRCARYVLELVSESR